MSSSYRNQWIIKQFNIHVSKNTLICSNDLNHCMMNLNDLEEKFVFETYFDKLNMSNKSLIRHCRAGLEAVRFFHYNSVCKLRFNIRLKNVTLQLTWSSQYLSIQHFLIYTAKMETYTSSYVIKKKKKHSSAESVKMSSFKIRNKNDAWKIWEKNTKSNSFGFLLKE